MTENGSRRDTRAKHQEAARLRACGFTWQQIADKLGYRSRTSAQSAVERYWARERELPEMTRRSAVEAMRLVQSTLFESFASAKRRGSLSDLVLVAREIRQTTDQIARLEGLHAPERVDVTITQTQTQLIDQLERRLLDTIDAEVVEVREISG